MTAPAAPVLRVNSNGWTLRCRWRPVDNATDYRLYVGEATSPSGIEAEFDELDMGSDGWYHFTFRPDDQVSFLYLTALNALAEESAASNEVRVELT